MAEVKISFIEAGYCTHSEKVAFPKGKWSSRVFPATVAVIEHSKEGVLLFDTGYSERFFAATEKFPNALYRWLTPVFLEEGQTAKAQLAKMGIAETDVRHIILSHFHADHIGGVSDFTKARYLYDYDCYQEVKDLRSFSALRKAFLPALLPDDFLERSLPIKADASPSAPNFLRDFSGAHDLFGDGTLWLIQLPGHTTGHRGLFVRTQTGDFLLAGDACYVQENFLENVPSSFLTRLLFSDFSDYRNTLDRIHSFHQKHPQTRVVPCHCSQTLHLLPHFST
jgi:glyoxylase-like metal-dependent hydrolase (beta-lactamase superfamily II)